MAMRSVFSRGGLKRLMEGSKWPSSASSLRYFSDGGRVLSEEERAMETVYIQKMERERMEKLKKKQQAEQEKADKEKSDKAGEGASKS